MSTYKALTQEEWEWEECKNEHSLFIESLHQMIGPHVMLSDWVSLGMKETLHYDPHKDESQNAEMFPMLDEEPDVILECGTNM